jgi:hypothetical protein
VVLERFGLSLWFHGLLRQLNAASIDATRNNAMTTPTKIKPRSIRSIVLVSLRLLPHIGGGPDAARTSPRYSPSRRFPRDAGASRCLNPEGAGPGNETH